MAEGKVLIGRKAICKYIGVSKNLFYPLINEGLPAQKGVGGWRAHAEVLDDYFKKILQPPRGSVKT